MKEAPKSEGMNEESEEETISLRNAILQPWVLSILIVYVGFSLLAYNTYDVPVFIQLIGHIPLLAYFAILIFRRKSYRELLSSRDSARIVPVVLLWVYVVTFLSGGGFHNYLTDIQSNVLHKSLLILGPIALLWLEHRVSWSNLGIRRGLLADTLLALPGPLVFYGIFIAFGLSSAVVLEHSDAIDLFVLSSLLPAITEEIVFRGILQDRISQHMRSRLSGLILTSLAFGFGHIFTNAGETNPDLFQGIMLCVLQQFISGLVLGAAYEMTGCVFVPMAIHYMNNIVAWLFAHPETTYILRPLQGVALMATLTLAVVFWIVPPKLASEKFVMKWRLVIMNKLKMTLARLRDIPRKTWAYLLSLAMLLVFLTLQNVLQDPPAVHPSEVLNRVLWIHLTFGILWIAGFAAIYGYRQSVRTREEEVVPSGEPFNVTVEFLLARSDNLDRVIGYLRSGVSIILGFGTAIILWLLNLERDLTDIESALFFALIGLVFFSSTAVLRSFSEVSVSSHESLLREDLLPLAQPENVYTQQLKELTSKKQDMISAVKQTIGVGLLWLMTALAMFAFGLIYGSPPAEPADSLVSAVTLVSSFMYIAICVILPIVALSELGLLGTKQPKSAENSA